MVAYCNPIKYQETSDDDVHNLTQSVMCNYDSLAVWILSGKGLLDDFPCICMLITRLDHTSYNELFLFK